MDYKNNSNTGLIIVADCMLLSVEYIGNVHLFFNTLPQRNKNKQNICCARLPGRTHIDCRRTTERRAADSIKIKREK